jgi:hypothetical protein
MGFQNSRGLMTRMVAILGDRVTVDMSGNAQRSTPSDYYGGTISYRRHKVTRKSAFPGAPDEQDTDEIHGHIHDMEDDVQTIGGVLLSNETTHDFENPGESDTVVVTIGRGFGSP